MPLEVILKPEDLPNLQVMLKQVLKSLVCTKQILKSLVYNALLHLAEMVVQCQFRLQFHCATCSSENHQDLPYLENSKRIQINFVFCLITSIFTILLLKFNIEFFFLCHSRMRQIPMARAIPYPVQTHLKFQSSDSLE